jgi:hypothetical protein
MDDKNNNFNGRQSTTDEHIDEDAEHQYSPQEQRGMPIFPYVGIRVVQTGKLKDQIGDEEAY